MPQYICLHSVKTWVAYFQSAMGESTQSTVAFSGINPVHLPPDQLWQQCFTDNNLNTARNWLLAQSREQDHSDVWDHVRHWAENKTDLQQRLTGNTFGFRPVREIHFPPYSVRCTSAHWTD